MDYFYLRNITEIKEEYTTFLINIMNPFIYEGIKSVYSFAMNAHKEFLERGKYDAETKSPGILKLFQLSLKEIQTLNNHSIEIETNRIKAGSKCSEWFDDLVRAVIKSHIVLLTFSNTRKHPEILKEQFHNKIEIKDFIHKCYIESAKLIYNNPELFWHEFPPLEIKRNQREACNLIKLAIQEAIRKMLPYKIILREYLQNDYDDEFGNKVSDSRYMNIQAMVNRDLNGNMDYENDPLGRQKVPVDNALDNDVNDKDSENYYSEGENHSGGSDASEESESSSSSRSSEDYLENNDESSSDGNKKDRQDEFLESVKEKLNNLEEQEHPRVMQSHEQRNEQRNETKQNHSINLPEIPRMEQSSKAPTPLKLPTPPIIVQAKQSKTFGGEIPKADMDTEVKNLVAQSNSLINEKKGKVNKREQQLFEELEQHIKKEEPDRKTFFEQYMK